MLGTSGIGDDGDECESKGDHGREGRVLRSTNQDVPSSQVQAVVTIRQNDTTRSAQVHDTSFVSELGVTDCCENGEAC
jgi:hypothetical protein